MVILARVAGRWHRDSSSDSIFPAIISSNVAELATFAGLPLIGK